MLITKKLYYEVAPVNKLLKKCHLIKRWVFISSFSSSHDHQMLHDTNLLIELFIYYSCVLDRISSSLKNCQKQLWQLVLFLSFHSTSKFLKYHNIDNVQVTILGKTSFPSPSKTLPRHILYLTWIISYKSKIVEQSQSFSWHWQSEREMTVLVVDMFWHSWGQWHTCQKLKREKAFHEMLMVKDIRRASRQTLVLTVCGL